MKGGSGREREGKGGKGREREGKGGTGRGREGKGGSGSGPALESAASGVPGHVHPVVGAGRMVAGPRFHRATAGSRLQPCGGIR